MSENNKSNFLFFLFIGFLSVILRCLLSSCIFVDTTEFEEAQMGGDAFRIITNYFFLNKIDFNQEFLFSKIVAIVPFLIWTPSLFILRLGFFLFGIFTILFFIYTLYKFKINKIISFLFSIILSCHPFFVYSSLMADESLITTNIAILMFCTILLLKKSPSFLNYIFLFILFSISFYEYIAVKIFMGCYLLVLIILTLRNIKIHKKYGLYFLIGLGLSLFLTNPFWTNPVFFDGPQRHLFSGQNSLINDEWRMHFAMYKEWFFQLKNDYEHFDFFYFTLPPIVSKLIIVASILTLLYMLFSCDLVLIATLGLTLFTVISSALVAYNYDIKRILPCVSVSILSLPFAYKFIYEKISKKFIVYPFYFSVLVFIIATSYGIKREISFDHAHHFSSADNINYYLCDGVVKILKKENFSNENNIIFYELDSNTSEVCQNDFSWVAGFKTPIKTFKDLESDIGISSDNIYFFLSSIDLKEKVNDIKEKLNDFQCEIFEKSTEPNKINIVYFKGSSCKNL